MNILVNKTADVRTRIEPDLKASAQEVLQKNGLSLSDAVRLFLRQVVIHNGLPFELRIPNEATARALKESMLMENRLHFDSAEDMFRELEKDEESRSSS